MRKFSSYGPINTQSHYYAPRQELLVQAFTQLVGENPEQGGHYITVWAPRQAGKTWVMQQVLFGLQREKQYERFDVVKINLEDLKLERDVNAIVRSLANSLATTLDKQTETINSLEHFKELFTRDVLEKPLILILDEFDALAEDAINGIVSTFRNIYTSRQDQSDRPIEEKTYLLHSVALIGVRSVLGIENVKGSPFNVQRSLHIPNLTYQEVEGMFLWYERESGQHIEQEVIRQLYRETRGQPGLTCWFGELLTEGFEEYQPPKDRSITPTDFDEVYAAAIKILPNSNILNIISKARQMPYKEVVFELLKTDLKVEFAYDDPSLNFLYMNGVIDREKVDSTDYYARFSSPFVQKRLFNAFARELFGYVGKLYEPFEDLSTVFTDTGLNIRNLLQRYETYLKANRDWLLKDAPRRSDLRIYEAVYHFNLYMYLREFLKLRKGKVYPEFPTGNGKIDLIIHCQGKVYGLEVKSYTDASGYKEALTQAARYGRELKLSEISLAFFVEYVDDANRQKYEVTYVDQETGVTVFPMFVETDR